MNEKPGYALFSYVKSADINAGSPDINKMGKSTDTNQTDAVLALIGQLEPAQAEVVMFLRKIILDTDPVIGEQIKWHSPAFFYTGPMNPFNPKEYKRDMVVVNLHRGKILLVFPTGATVDDGRGILEGNYADGRRMVNIQSLTDAREKADGLQTVIRQWLDRVEK